MTPMSIPRVRIAVNPCTPRELTPEDHIRVTQEATRIVRELDARYRKMETLSARELMLRLR